MGLTVAQVAILNRQGRETRAAEERAEQVELERFEKTKLEISRQKERMKVEMDRLKLSEDLAKLRAATQERGQDISERTARLGREATAPHQEALTAESRARTRKLDSLLGSLSEASPLDREFKRLVEDISMKSIQGGLGPDEFNNEAILQRAAAILISEGTPYKDVNAMLRRSGIDPLEVPNIPQRIVFGTEEEVQERLRQIKAQGFN